MCMECYIYFIINKSTGQRYVGQTTDFARRKKEHLEKLRRNKHPNVKLQNSFNYYGENEFVFENIYYPNLTKDQLNEKEKYYISKYETFGDKGFNLTAGGTGGDTRSKLNFQQYCFAYFGNKAYQGMTNRTGKYLGVDSSCISAIAREQSYDNFRQRANKLSKEEKEKIIKDFEEKMNLKIEQPIIQRSSPDDETTLKIMCVVSSYGRGIEKTILDYFDLSKGFIYHLMKGNGRQEVKNKYNNLSKEQIIQIGKNYFTKWDLQKYSKLKIKQCYNNLNERYNCGQ